MARRRLESGGGGCCGVWYARSCGVSSRSLAGSWHWFSFSLVPPCLVQPCVTMAQVKWVPWPAHGKVRWRAIVRGLEAGA